ncbi:MAG: hypothetical protein HY718_00330, partial [Planctomycetes bacterium]|nr:hypothetical protein [Planctomycetota bacterium]
PRRGIRCSFWDEQESNHDGVILDASHDGVHVRDIADAKVRLVPLDHVELLCAAQGE